MKACGDCAAKRASKRSTTTWSMPQRSSSASLSRSVAMRAGASSGLPARRGEEVARMRLEGHHARRQAAVPGFGCAAAPASPGGRGARRRSCRSSARSAARCRGGGSRGRLASGDYRPSGSRTFGCALTRRDGLKGRVVRLPLQGLPAFHSGVYGSATVLHLLSGRLRVLERRIRGDRELFLPRPQARLRRSNRASPPSAPPMIRTIPISAMTAGKGTVRPPRLVRHPGQYPERRAEPDHPTSETRYSATAHREGINKADPRRPTAGQGDDGIVPGESGRQPR